MRRPLAIPPSRNAGRTEAQKNAKVVIPAVLQKKKGAKVPIAHGHNAVLIGTVKGGQFLAALRVLLLSPRFQSRIRK
jgi:hypothetical protein